MHDVHVLYRDQLTQKATTIMLAVLNRAPSACPLDKALQLEDPPMEVHPD